MNSQNRMYGVVCVGITSMFCMVASAANLVNVYSVELPEQDVIDVSGMAYELTDPFDLFNCLLTWEGYIPCPSEYGGHSGWMRQVKMLNLTSVSYADLYYVADPETTLTNYDGKIGNAGMNDANWAFRIDNIGLNTPLIAGDINSNLIFDPGEAWVFVIQEYQNALGITAEKMGSGGIASNSGGDLMSSGSVIAMTPEPASLVLLALAGLTMIRRRPA